MLRLLTLLAALAAAPALSCGRAVCEVGPDEIRLVQQVAFDRTPSGFGPGMQVRGVLDLGAIVFGERFGGQSVSDQDGYDRIEGRALPPLAVVAGEERYNLSVLRLASGNVLTGDGPMGYPDERATGEGAIAFLFSEDQVAMRLYLRGGEGGVLEVSFLNRHGEELDRHVIEPLGEGILAFVRNGEARDIAGVTLTNRDPQGIALERIEFDNSLRLGLLQALLPLTPG